MQNNNVDLPKIITRFELIKSLIALEEEEEIATHIGKLQQIKLDDVAKKIVTLIENKSYSLAIEAINNFNNKHHQLTTYIDPQIQALKLEVKVLEIELNALSDEKADTEKLIHSFNVRHNQELGELILKILQHRKQQAKGTVQQEETEQDYNNYNTDYETTKNETIATLTQDEQKELKDKYRKLSKSCHLDVVSEEQKELATKLFAELSAAYEKIDLARVNEILENLENGNFFVSKSDTINEKKLLQAEIEKLRIKFTELKQELQAIKESETYKTITTIDDWDSYFSNTKKQLMEQANELE